jgi:hypothetical protein
MGVVALGDPGVLVVWVCADAVSDAVTVRTADVATTKVALPMLRIFRVLLFLKFLFGKNQSDRFDNRRKPQVLKIRD